MLVATVRAMKMNGGVARRPIWATRTSTAVTKGCDNLGRHIENLKKFGVPVVVAINHFVTDTDAEVAAVKAFVEGGPGSEAILCKHWADGWRRHRRIWPTALWPMIDEGKAATIAPIYPDEMPLFEKIETIAKEIYRADEVQRRQEDPHPAERSGRRRAMATCRSAWRKRSTAFRPTQPSAARRRGHSMPVREVRLSAGAGFIVAICGEIMTMPGLPRVPSAEAIRINDEGQIDGLF